LNGDDLPFSSSPHLLVLLPVEKYQINTQDFLPAALQKELRGLEQLAQTYREGFYRPLRLEEFV